MNTKPKRVKLWWISFSGDDGFLGAVIGEGDEFDDVFLETHKRGCNPGGEILANYKYADEIKDEWLLNAPRWKLMRRHEINQPVRLIHEADGTVTRLYEH